MRSEQVNDSNSEIEKLCEAVTARFLPRLIVVRDNCVRSESGGRDGIRTHDLLIANDVNSKLRRGAAIT